VGAALSLGLALAIPAGVTAQDSRSSLSSGSGAGAGTGTGAGAGTGSAQPGTGSITGPGSLRPGLGIGGVRPSMGPQRGRDTGPIGAPGAGGVTGNQTNVPGIDAPRLDGAGGPSRLPDDTMAPMEALTGPPTGVAPGQINRMDSELLPRARAIPDPIERSLALDRVARSKIVGHEYAQAHTALEEASEAALATDPGLVRDLRLMAIVATMNSLADVEVREMGIAVDPYVTEAPTTSSRTSSEKQRWLDSAMYQWRRSAEVAAAISNRNYRSDTLYQVVDSQAKGSRDIANAGLQLNGPSADRTGPGQPLLDLADRALVWAQEHAQWIERPVWRDQALVTIVAEAAASDQFARGLEIARAIPQPSFRTDGMLRIAEAQSRRGRQGDASSSYAEAARAVASIPLEDPRGVLAAVLVDSLLSTGRFEDARRCIGFFPAPEQRVFALGAIAQAQGERGLANEANDWIDREAPADLRSQLHRRVIDGLRITIDKARTTESNRGPSMLIPGR
jgi:hypothetical protein